MRIPSLLSRATPRHLSLSPHAAGKAPPHRLRWISTNPSSSRPIPLSSNACSAGGLLATNRTAGGGKSKEWGRKRGISDLMYFRTKDGIIRANLKAKHTVGIAQSRGERPYQEDTYVSTSILIPTQALKRNVAFLKSGSTSDALEGYPGEAERTLEEGGAKKQVALFGVFDGHGGTYVSKYLQSTLPTLLEAAHSIEVIPKVIKEYRAHGGYLRRYRGGPLERFREPIDDGNRDDRLSMGLDEITALAFLQADNAVLADPASHKAGSVGTIALLHSLDMPHSLPYYHSSLLSLTLSHIGDTRALLSSTSSGRVTTLTENHHPDSRVESIRLRQSGTGIVTDSFGESRWGGGLANTRGVGDREFKSLGVIAEPEVSTRVLKTEDWAFLVLVSDGITDSMSDQEIVDLTRGQTDPTRAAQKIVTFAEDVGGDDNMTAVVIPLGGWLRRGGVDTSSSLREFRLRQGAGQSSRQKRM